MPDTVAAAIDGWLAQLRARQLSPHTLAAYGRDLGKLQVWMHEEAIERFDQLDADRLRGLVAREHRAGLSPASLQRLLCACRGLFRHLVREGRLQGDPAAGLRAPRRQRRLPEVLDADEARALVELPANGALARRDRAMLELFYSSGLRLAELVGLRWGDVDLDDGQARVLGKGRKTRIVPIGRHAREALRALAADGAAPDQPVFRGRGGAPLSPRSVQLRLKQAALKSGLPRNVYPHLLRHSCASHLLESSGELRAVQELLGHADIRTTEIYTHLDFQHLARVYDAAHPRARKR